jgi:hypothetical protein
MVVISAGRRPVAGIVGRCWSAALLYSAAVQLLASRARLGLAIDRETDEAREFGGDDGSAGVGVVVPIRTVGQWRGVGTTGGGSCAVVGLTMDDFRRSG